MQMRVGEQAGAGASSEREGEVFGKRGEPALARDRSVYRGADRETKCGAAWQRGKVG